ncbi:hypothetical protein BHM03_00048124 [Ensete ventricosum]|nr:hypothetical protein BHM03_00048124 [Ensete ventricosum]
MSNGPRRAPITSAHKGEGSGAATRGCRTNFGPCTEVTRGGGGPLGTAPCLSHSAPGGGQPTSPLQIPMAPSLGVVALLMESSIEEAPNPPQSLTRQGPCVDSLNPSLGLHATFLPCEKVDDEPSTLGGRVPLKV